AGRTQHHRARIRLEWRHVVIAAVGAGDGKGLSAPSSPALVPRALARVEAALAQHRSAGLGTKRYLIRCSATVAVHVEQLPWTASVAVAASLRLAAVLLLSVPGRVMGRAVAHALIHTQTSGSHMPFDKSGCCIADAPPTPNLWVLSARCQFETTRSEGRNRLIGPTQGSKSVDDCVELWLHERKADGIAPELDHVARVGAHHDQGSALERLAHERSPGHPEPCARP